MTQRLMNYWKFFSFALLLVFVLIGGQAQAAVHHQNMRPSLYCNVRTYALDSTATFERSSGQIIQLQPDNINHSPAVDIWHGSTYEGLYALTAYDGDVGYGYELEIYSYGGSDRVDICTNWTSI